MAEIATKKTFSWSMFCENLWTYIHLLDYRLCFQVFWLHYIYIGETSATANWQFWENQVNDWTVLLAPRDTVIGATRRSNSDIVSESHFWTDLTGVTLSRSEYSQGPTDVTVTVGDTYGDDVRGNDGGAGHGFWQDGATWWPDFQPMQVAPPGG